MVAVAMSWPSPLVPRTSPAWHPDSPSRSGGQSMNGSEQIIASPASRWRTRIVVPIHTETKVLAYRAMIAQLQGRAGTILVPKWENFGPHDQNGRRLSYGDGGANAPYFDLSGIGQSDLTYATLAADAALNATRITVNLDGTEGPRPGQYFGIGQRLHLCQNVWQENEGDPTTIQFAPWLRESAVAGTRVILDRPVCLMRLVSDDSGELALDEEDIGNPTLEFVEAI